MRISRISHFKARVSLLEVHAALLIIESILHIKMNKHNASIGSNSIYFPTFVPRFIRSEILSCSMRNYLLCCCIVFISGSPIRISNSSCMMTGFIVIALSVEGKSSNHGPHSIVINLEILSLINIGQILCQLITGTSNYQVQDIRSAANTNQSARTQVNIACQRQNTSSCNPYYQQNCCDQCLTMFRILFRFQAIQVLSKTRFSIWICLLIWIFHRFLVRGGVIMIGYIRILIVRIMRIIVLTILIIIGIVQELFLHYLFLNNQQKIYPKDILIRITSSKLYQQNCLDKYLLTQSVQLNQVIDTRQYRKDFK